MICLRFRIRERVFAVAANEIAEVIFLPELSRPPGLPWLLEGFAVIGQSAVPVLRLDRLFALSELELFDYNLILLARSGERLHGWLVDDVDELETVEPSQLIPLSPGASFHNCVAAGYAKDGAEVYLLSARRVLLEQERLAVDELAHAVETRLAKLVANS